MLRVARRGVVLGTWDVKCPDGSEPWRYEQGTWVYDHRRLLQGRADVRMESLPVRDEIWKDERWRRYGALLRLSHAGDARWYTPAPVS